ncbi:AAA family ATPase [Nocardia farcinica]|uniref:AAA family ATPase n=1 Tax=Nocardia farcinica TaxID=37329 RepID=UPI00245698BB|nr:ATP-binding protein [Nocardia farcinica]
MGEAQPVGAMSAHSRLEWRGNTLQATTRLKATAIRSGAYAQEVMPSRLVELRLSAFKSFHGATLPLGRTTILIGRNSSGKSNAFDGLEVLARLAEGEDLADALDGRRREGGTVRGGSAGCPPHGSSRFELGCSVEIDDDRYEYDLTVEVRPDLRVVAEKLYGPGQAVKSGIISYGPLIETREPGAPGTGIVADIHNGKRGSNTPYTFRDSRIILSQVPLALSGTNRAEMSVIRGAKAVLLALRGIFHLDPVPHLMRSFIPSRDAELRRTGENLSAALQRLQRQDVEAFNRVQELVRSVADDRVEEITFVASDLGDVMLSLKEIRGKEAAIERTPAREMSDGLLRFTAIATALLSSQYGLDVDASVGARTEIDEGEVLRGGVLIVIEELENGLHPSQARQVLDLVRSSSKTPGTSVLVTTHSPAILDAAEGSLNENVIVCHRDQETGFSTLTPLMEIPGYTTALAEGSLGDAAISGKLSGDADDDPGDYSEFERLLGIR